jgi:predicted transcriptional regulator
MPTKRISALPSRGELRILQVLWTLGEGTVEDVVNHHRSPEKPNYKTTQTLLRIMEEKGFVRHSARGRVFVFEPTVTREEVGRQSVRDVLEHNFGGSPIELVVNLIEGARVDESELADLERLIRGYREKKNGHNK